MKKLALSAVAILALAAGVSAQAPNFTGKWEGTLTGINADGTTRQPGGIVFDLTQKGNQLTGTAGPSAEQQLPIAKAAVNGSKGSFEVTQPNGVLHKLTFTLANGKITGDMVSELNGETRNGKFELSKAAK
jgi:hypothetical protein